MVYIFKVITKIKLEQQIFNINIHDGTAWGCVTLSNYHWYGSYSIVGLKIYLWRSLIVAAFYYKQLLNELYCGNMYVATF